MVSSFSKSTQLIGSPFDEKAQISQYVSPDATKKAQSHCIGVPLRSGRAAGLMSFFGSFLLSSYLLLWKSPESELNSTEFVGKYYDGG